MITFTPNTIPHVTPEKLQLQLNMGLVEAVNHREFHRNRSLVQHLPDLTSRTQRVTLHLGRPEILRRTLGTSGPACVNLRLVYILEVRCCLLTYLRHLQD